MDLSIPGGG